METSIAAMNATVGVPAGASRNARRDSIFQEMLCHAHEVCFLFVNDDIGHTLANVAIVSCNAAASLTVSMIDQVLSWCTHSSAYVAYKSRRCVASVASMVSEDCKAVIADKIVDIVATYKDDRSVLVWGLDVALVVCSARVSQDSFMGSMMGTAVGDAVGLPVEGFNRDLCTQYVDQIVKPVMLSTFHRHNFTFGQYSDDTQLTREMYLSVLQGRGKMDPVVYGLRIAMLFQPNAYRVVGYGKQTARAADAIRNGAHYSESGCAKGQGNGSVMRSACLGVILAHKTKEEIINTAKVMSAITHASPACLDGAVAIALAAHYAMATRALPFDVKHFVEYVATGVSNDFAAYVRELLELRTMSLDLAARRIVEIGTSNKERRWGDGISVGARQTALWALWSFVRSPDSFVDCMANAIGVGGDVDTTAATAGGIIGARVGHDAIPLLWRSCLHDYNEWNYEQLCDVGCKVYEMVKKNSVVLV
jgi:ADP-ribosylglycohydrolase